MSRALALWSIASLLISLSTQQVAWANSDNCLERFPRERLTIEYYPIDGRNADDLYSALLAHGPIDPYGMRRFAYTRWSINWSWPTPEGQHQIGDITARYSISMQLPRWTSQESAITDASLRAQWKEFEQALVRHECQHASHAADNVQRIEEAVRGALARNAQLTPAEAHRVAFEELARIRELDTALDERTDYGKKEGVTLPLITQKID